MQAAGHVNADTRFSIVNLREPPKEVVWSWSKGMSIPRQALEIVRQGVETYEAVIDLSAGRLLSWTERRDIQPGWLAEEFRAMTAEVKKNASFVEAMKKRGITDFTFVTCSDLPPG